MGRRGFGGWGGGEGPGRASDEGAGGEEVVGRGGGAGLGGRVWAGHVGQGRVRNTGEEVVNGQLRNVSQGAS